MFRKIQALYPNGVNSENFIEAVTFCMKEAGKITQMDGKDKKSLVLINLTFCIQDPTLKELIPFLVDQLISVEKGKIRINPKIKFLTKFCCN